MPIYKRIVIAFIVLIVMFACYIGFDNYQSEIIQNQVAESRLYWSRALDSARDNNQSVQDFVSFHSDRATVIEQHSTRALLREIIPVNSFICSEWSLDITLSWAGGDSSRFTRLSEECYSH